MEYSQLHEGNQLKSARIEKGRALRVSIVADRLECSISHVYNLICSKKLSAIKTGKKKGVRVYEIDLERFVAECSLDD